MLYNHLLCLCSEWWPNSINSVLLQAVYLLLLVTGIMEQEGISTQDKEAQVQTVQVITQLPDILQIGDNELLEVYIASLDIIHQYNVKDVQETLCKLRMETLNVLHKSLCEKVVATFPQYKDKGIVNRQKHKTIVPDIFNLGSSIVNKLAAKDLDKIFIGKDQPEPEPSDPKQAKDLEDLMSLLLKLRDRVCALEAAQKKSEEANQLLRDELLALHLSKEQEATEQPPELPDSQSKPLASSTEQTNTVPASVIDTSDEESSKDDLIPTEQQSSKWKKRLSKKARKEAKKQQKPTEEVSSETSTEPIIKAATNRTKSTTKQSELCEVKAASKNDDLFIGNIDRSNTVEHIKRHISRLGVQCVGEPLELSKPSYSKKSFKVTVPKASSAIVLSKDRWPGGVDLRHFRAQPPRVRSSTGGRHHRQPSNNAPHNNRSTGPRRSSGKRQGGFQQQQGGFQQQQGSFQQQLGGLQQQQGGFQQQQGGFQQQWGGLQQQQGGYQQWNQGQQCNSFGYQPYGYQATNRGY